MSFDHQTDPGADAFVATWLVGIMNSTRGTDPVRPRHRLAGLPDLHIDPANAGLRNHVLHLARPRAPGEPELHRNDDLTLRRIVQGASG